MRKTALRVRKLGHAVLKVRCLDVSVPFYRDVLGLTEVARYGSRRPDCPPAPLPARRLRARPNHDDYRRRKRTPSARKNARSVCILRIARNPT